MEHKTKLKLHMDRHNKKIDTNNIGKMQRHIKNQNLINEQEAIILAERGNKIVAYF